MSGTVPEPNRPAGYAGPTDPAAGQSIGELLGQVTSDLSTLMHQELELAKVEAKQSATKAGKGAGMLGGAGLAANLMLIFLSLALAWLIGGWLGDSLGWGALVVGLIWGIVAAVLALQGKKEFKDLGLQQTAETASKIPNALKGNE